MIRHCSRCTNQPLSWVSPFLGLFGPKARTRLAARQVSPTAPTAFKARRYRRDDVTAGAPRDHGVVFRMVGGGAWKRPVRARGMPLCYRDAIFSLRSGCKVAPRRREGKSAGDGWLMTETSSLLMSSLDDVILLNYQLLVVISVYRMFTYLVLLPTHAIWILK